MTTHSLPRVKLNKRQGMKEVPGNISKDDGVTCVA